MKSFKTFCRELDESTKKSYIATIKHSRTRESRTVKFQTSRSPKNEVKTKLLQPLEYLHSIELNSVKESVDLDESVKKEQMKLIKMTGIKHNPDITTAVHNGDFVVHNRGFVVGKIEKGKWEQHAPSLNKIHNPEKKKEK